MRAKTVKKLRRVALARGLNLDHALYVGQYKNKMGEVIRQELVCHYRRTMKEMKREWRFVHGRVL